MLHTDKGYRNQKQKGTHNIPGAINKFSRHKVNNQILIVNNQIHQNQIIVPDYKTTFKKGLNIVSYEPSTGKQKPEVSMNLTFSDCTYK